MSKIRDNTPLFDGDPDVDDANHSPIKANAGFQYEVDLIRKLRSQGFVCGDPAGADNAKADLELTLPKNAPKVTKFELKEKLSADFAQLNMDFDNSSNQFYIDESKTSNQKEAAQTMIGIAKNFRIISEANNHWKPKTNIPAKFTLPNSANVNQKKAAYALDIKRFPDKFLAKGGSLAAEQVEKYYNSKNTFYIQIKGKGLYCLGRDPEGFGVPKFSSMVGDSSIRIRIKANSKSKGQYSFLMALKIGRLRNSNFNLDKDASFLIK